jgi:hypothetical protein
MWPFSKRQNKQYKPQSAVPSDEYSLTRSDRSPLSAPISAPVSSLSSFSNEDEDTGLASLADSSVFGDLSSSATSKAGFSGDTSCGNRSTDSKDED